MKSHSVAFQLLLIGRWPCQSSFHTNECCSPCVVSGYATKAGTYFAPTCNCFYASVPRPVRFLDIASKRAYSTKRNPFLRQSSRRCSAAHTPARSDRAASNRTARPFYHRSSLMSTSFQRADLDPTCGTGRAMACRPVGVRVPKCVDSRWMMRRSTSCSRVSAMRSRTSPDSRMGSQEFRYSG